MGDLGILGVLSIAHMTCLDFRGIRFGVVRFRVLSEGLGHLRF